MVLPTLAGSMSTPPTKSIQLFSRASLTDSMPMGPRPNWATLILDCTGAALLIVKSDYSMRRRRALKRSCSTRQWQLRLLPRLAVFDNQSLNALRTKLLIGIEQFDAVDPTVR